MTKGELIGLKHKVLRRKEKAADMDVLVTAILALPYGQVKKLLSEDVLAVLAKYGYTEDGQ